MLERYGHGGDLWTAAEAFGRSREQFLDFSSNMNPFGPPAVVEQIMKTEWRDIVRYPDPAVRELRKSLSKKYDIPMECLLVGNGAAELIDLVVRVLHPKVTGLARPSFSEYEEAVHKTRGGIYELPLNDKEDFVLQELKVAKAWDECDLLFLGHPNNPSGRLLSPGVLEHVAACGKQVIADEAFIDFVPNEEKVTLLQKAAFSKDLVVVRSMTKFYAIPGIRLGFVVAHPDTIRSMQQQQVQWSVNYLAQRIGTAVLGDNLYADMTHAWLKEEKPWLTAQLEALGLKVVPSDVNFLLVSFSKDSGLTASKAQKLMGVRGILVRDASLFRGLDERYCRVAIRLRHENEQLVAGLRNMMQEWSASGGDAKT